MEIRDKTLSEIFGDNLAEEQKKRKLSNKDLARMIGVSVRQINRYRNYQCDISLSTVERIAKALGVDDDILLSRH